MSWTDWVCLSIVIFGFILFLHGANFYNTATGWLGVSFFFGGILLFLVLYIYSELKKKSETQNP